MARWSGGTQRTGPKSSMTFLFNIEIMWPASKYGYYQEYGRDKKQVFQRVKYHTRRLTHFFGVPLAFPIKVFVPSYSRRPTYEGQPFIRPAVQKYWPKAIRTMRATIFDFLGN